MEFSSDAPHSESKKEGIKDITHAVYDLLKVHHECSYQFICQKISVQNNVTATRRVYDILNVMRAVNLIVKRGKSYSIVDCRDGIAKKKEELARLEEMKESFLFITTRNKLLSSSTSEKLFLPFMVISGDKKSEIYCNTNEERSFFNFKSNKPLTITEDLDILKEIQAQTKKMAKTQTINLEFDTFMF